MFDRSLQLFNFGIDITVKQRIKLVDMYWKQMIEILEVLEVPGFVAYPYLDDPFDDIDNQDKYLLHDRLDILSLIYTLNYISAMYQFYFSSLMPFPSPLSQCNYKISNTGYYGNDLLNQYNILSNTSLSNMINLYQLQKDTYFQSPYISCLSSSINSNLSKMLFSYILIYTSFISSCNILKSIEATFVYTKFLQCLKPFISNLTSIVSLMNSGNSIRFGIENLQMLLSIMGDLSLIDLYLARLQWTKTYIETLNFYISILTSSKLIRCIVHNLVVIKYNFGVLLRSFNQNGIEHTTSIGVSGSNKKEVSITCIGCKIPQTTFRNIGILITNIDSVIARLELLEEIIKHLDLINQMTLCLEHLKYLIVNVKILVDYVNRSMSLNIFKNHLEIIKSFLEHLKCIKENVNTLKDFESSLNDVITCVYVLNSMDTLGSINKYLRSTEEIIKYLKKIQSTFDGVNSLISLIKKEQTPESFLQILQSVKSNVGSLKNTQELIQKFAELMKGYIDYLKRSSESNIESLKLIESISTVIESSGDVINYLESLEFVINNMTLVQHVLMNFVSSISVLGRLKSFQVVTKSLQNIEIVIILLKWYRKILEELQYSVSMVDIKRIDLIIGDLKKEAELEGFGVVEDYEGQIHSGGRITYNLKKRTKTELWREKIVRTINTTTYSFINLKGVLSILSYILGILHIKGIISVMGSVQSVKFFVVNLLNIDSIEKDARRIGSSRGILAKILGYNYISYLITTLTQVLRGFSYLESTLASSRSIMTNIVFITYNESVLKQILNYISNLNTTINIDVTNLESSLETVMQDFIKKSIQSTICNLKGSHSGGKQDGTNMSIVTSKSSSNQYGNSWEILSHSVVADSKFVITRLYESTIDTNKMLYILRNVEDCSCVLSYKWETDNLHLMYHIFDNYPLIHSYSHKKFHIKSLMKDETNNLCLCLVIKFHLYPILVKSLCYLNDIYFDNLSTSSREFNKYTNSTGYKNDLSKSLFLAISLFEKITYSICDRYLCKCGKRPCRCIFRYQPVELKGGSRSLVSEIGKWAASSYVFGYKISSAILGPFLPYWISIFCKKPNDPYYQFYIATIMFICHLIENIFEEEDTTGDSIQSLSILVDELSTIGHTTKDKCPAGQQTGESQCPSDITINNIMLVELYESLASIFSQNLRLLKFGGVYFLLGLEFFVDQLSIIPSILNQMVKSNWNNSIVSYFISIEDRIMATRKNSGGLPAFYQFFSMLSFSLINSKCLCEKDKQKVREVTIFVSSVYISMVYEKKKGEDNECFFKEPGDRILVASFITLIYYLYNDISLQLSNKVVLDFMEYSEDCKKEDKIGYYLTLRTISYPESMCKYSRTNRIVDSTNETTNNKLKGPSDNHYSYNDDYRINTSRAHGSLILQDNYCTHGPRWSTIPWLI